MRIRMLAGWTVAVAMLTAVLVADDHSVIFDEDVDFAQFKTFSMRETRMTSDRPELNFPAVMETIGESIRRSLNAARLKETADPSDLVVDVRVTGVDYSIGPFGRPNVIRPGGRGRGGPVDLTEATVVLDISRGSPDSLLWRGVFHDTENDARKLAEALPKDVSQLLSHYPPRRQR